MVPTGAGMQICCGLVSSYKYQCQGGCSDTMEDCPDGGVAQQSRMYEFMTNLFCLILCYNLYGTEVPRILELDTYTVQTPFNSGKTGGLVMKTSFIRQS